MIINRGELVADEMAETLMEQGKSQTQTIHVELEKLADPQIWGKLLFVNHVKHLGENQFLLETNEMRDVRADIFNFAVSQGLTILSLSLKKKSLEEVFREITRH
jgi:ABC-type multidrug transport system ATPase subunit